MPGGRPKYYQPPVIEDWEALDRQIDEFISSHSLATGTRRNHLAKWEIWTDHCARLNVDPLDAPFSSFEGLLLTTRVDGLPYLRGAFDNILAAVGAMYDQAGRVPAHKEPGNAGQWASLMKGVAKRGRNRAEAVPSSTEQWQVTPLLRDDLVSMLRVELPVLPATRARVAGALMAMDLELLPSQLARLDATDVTVGKDESLTVLGRVVVCDHRQRARGVPWDCTACAVQAVLREHDGTGPLLSAAATGDLQIAWSERLKRWRNRQWGGATVDQRSWGPHRCRLIPSAEMTQWQAAGFRRAVVLMATGDKRAGHWLRARAWTALAWTAGFRMCGDLLRLDRDSVRTDPSGRGYSVHLAATKDDPFGEKKVVRPLPWPSDAAEPSAVQIVVEYLCVRDAVHGPAGHLIVKNTISARKDPGAGIARGGVGVDGGTQVAASDLDLLADLAGITVRYSSYSTRKGFAEQAKLDGWTVEAIRDALRHATLGHVLNSYLVPAEAKTSASALMNGLIRGIE